MGRQYTIEHYLERLARIREAVPGITISTDIIVGFCGETEAQFEATLALLETVRYDQVFAAAYSPRPGTPATHLADDVPADVKRRRLNELLALQEGIGLERNEAWLGREAAVLVDAIVPPRGHDHDDAADGLDGAGRALACRAGPVATSWSISRARPSLVGHEVDGPDRARRPVRAPGRARRGVTTAPPLIVVAGPTATGKTALAIDLAEALRAAGRNAEIISADSRQVFRGLDIGTAKVTAADRARVPHHGLDLVDPDEPFSVADFVAHAGPGAGRPRGSATASRSWPAAPASTCARSPAASTPPRCRATAPSAPGWRPSWTKAAWTRWSCVSRLSRPISRRDRRPAQPAAGGPGARDRRAAGRRPATAGPRVRRAGRLARARRRARRRTRRSITARARAQFDGGLLDEARDLRERFDAGLPAFSAIGYREAWAVLDGTLDARRSHRARRAADDRVRQAPADVVPFRAGHRLAAVRHGRGRQ